MVTVNNNKLNSNKCKSYKIGETLLIRNVISKDKTNPRGYRIMEAMASFPGRQG